MILYSPCRSVGFDLLRDVGGLIFICRESSLDFFSLVVFIILESLFSIIMIPPSRPHLSVTIRNFLLDRIVHNL